MHLSSITLRGFKSFPDRTRLTFSPGVSVIVGPNGSGKSNITDAVLWALGEQSPLAVRGQSMQDVIFAGGHGVQARSEAEVEVVLDNDGGGLDLPVGEVSIVRRLNRAGEGEYRINGAQCRLTDVIEILSDTGLGKEMHSVVSQGRVEAIVTSKPRDRRMLIEEAAGLGKHRKRRRRAQLKLERTQDNLDRALDVEREARTRLRPLKRQAEAAELHERIERQVDEARWTLARDGARVARATLAEAEAAVAAARAAAEAAEAEFEAVGKRREAAEEALSARCSEREALSARFYSARSAPSGSRCGSRPRRASRPTSRTASRAAAARSRGWRRGAADTGDDGAAERIAALQAELAELAEDHRARLERELAELEERREAATALVAERTAEAQAAAPARRGRGRRRGRPQGPPRTRHRRRARPPRIRPDRRRARQGQPVPARPRGRPGRRLRARGHPVRRPGLRARPLRRPRPAPARRRAPATSRPAPRCCERAGKDGAAALIVPADAPPPRRRRSFALADDSFLSPARAAAGSG